jgi:hypothetical protein
VRRAAPGVAVVLSALVVIGVSGCGSNEGAATTSAPQASGPAPAASAPAAAKAVNSSLAGLIVVPAGFVPGDAADPGEHTGSFTRESYLSTLSASPSEDRALLLNAGFAEGYQAYRTSADRKKHFTVQIFRVGSKAKADILRHGFWGQETHSRAFAVPGVPEALTDARIVVSTAAGRTEAVAESSFVVGTLVTQISVSQTGDLTADLTPDTALVAAITRQQKQSLSRKSG